jgi:hypothetical protein
MQLDNDNVKLKTSSQSEVLNILSVTQTLAEQTGYQGYESRWSLPRSAFDHFHWHGVAAAPDYFRRWLRARGPHSEPAHHTKFK